MKYSKKEKQLKTIKFNNHIYETDGIKIRLVKYHKGGFLWVAQLSNFLRKQVKDLFLIEDISKS